MKLNNKYILVTVTFNNEKNAMIFSNEIVNKKLAACSQIIGPIKSIYRWKGKIEKAKEWLCLLKSTDNNFNKIKRFIQENHNYQTPEITSILLDNGSSDYLEWISNNVL